MSGDKKELERRERWARGESVTEVLWVEVRLRMASEQEGQSRRESITIVERNGVCLCTRGTATNGKRSKGIAGEREESTEIEQ